MYRIDLFLLSISCFFNVDGKLFLRAARKLRLRGHPNPIQGIWNWLGRSSGIGQEGKKFVISFSLFLDCYCRGLISAGGQGAKLCFHSGLGNIFPISDIP